MEINIKIDDETERKCVPIKDEYFISQYARVFDETCKGWTKDAEVNLQVLLGMQLIASEKLMSVGHLFLNDVYDMLGIPRTKAGQLVGWIYEPDSEDKDNYVDFMIHEKYNKGFINGYENTAILDFNVDGVIIDKL